MSKSKPDMPKYPLEATIKDGIPQWENPQKKANLLKFFEGQKVTFWIEKYSNIRSVRQNRFLWGTVYSIAMQGFKDIGYDVSEEDVHGIFTSMFLTRKRLNEVSGEEISFVQSTTTLSTVEFQEYWQRIQRFASENLNCYIPDPNEPIEEIL